MLADKKIKPIILLFLLNKFFESRQLCLQNPGELSDPRSNGKNETQIEIFTLKLTINKDSFVEDRSEGFPKRKHQSRTSDLI